MKTLCMIGLASILYFASAATQAKSACDIHHLGYTEKQCSECSNMTWSVSRVFPKGQCVSTAAPQPVTIAAPPPAKAACDIHHLGYTQAQCNLCTNMAWSVSKVFCRWRLGSARMIIREVGTA